jgi:hypothetical protein
MAHKTLPRFKRLIHKRNRMTEYIPKITNKDIERLVEREFDKRLSDLVYEKLNKVNAESENGKNRIWAAIIKLSKSDIDELQKNVEKANYDFRDVIAYAEYPNLSKEPFAILSVKDKKKKDEIFKKDKDQYIEWLYE